MLLVRATVFAALAVAGVGFGPIEARSPADLPTTAEEARQQLADDRQLGDPTKSEIYRVIADIGLLGTWSTNCGAPPSNAAPRSIYFVSSDGTVKRRLDRGKDHTPVDFTILSTHRLPENRVELVDQLGRGVVNILLEVRGDRYRTIQSKSNLFGVLVENGVQRVDGKQTPWFVKCSSQ
jgi:hypothetical protein